MKASAIKVELYGYINLKKKYSTLRRRRVEVCAGFGRYVSSIDLHGYNIVGPAAAGLRRGGGDGATRSE
jgi:hypothetical protein